MADKLQTVINTRTGESEALPPEEVAKRLSVRDEQGSVYKTKSGRTLMFTTDANGNQTPRFVSDDELRVRHRFYGQSPVSDNAQKFEAMRQRMVHEAEKEIAADSAGTAFLTSAANTASFGATSAITKRIVGEEEFLRKRADLAEQNRVASGLGSVVGVLAGGGVGLARAGVGVGRATTNALIARGVGVGKAGLAGRLAGATVFELPANIMLEAAHLTDTNKEFSGESLASVGLGTLFGLGVEAAFPVVGTLGRAFGKGTGKLASKIPAIGTPLTSAARKAGPVLRNAADRIFANRATREAAENAQKSLRAADNLRPSQLGSHADEFITSLQDDVLRANPDLIQNSSWIKFTDAVQSVKTLPQKAAKAAEQLQSLATQAKSQADVADISKLSLDYTGVNPKDVGNALVDYASVADEMADIGGAGLASNMAKVLTKEAFESPKAAAQAVLKNYVDEVAALSSKPGQAMDSQRLQLLRQETEKFLTNGVFSGQAPVHKSILDAIDALHINSAELKNLDTAFSELDTMTKPALLGGTPDDFIARAQQIGLASSTLADAGLLRSAGAKVLTTTADTVGAAVKDTLPGVDAAVALNNVRSAASRGTPISVVKDIPSTPAAVIANAYENMLSQLREIEVAKAALFSKGLAGSSVGAVAVVNQLSLEDKVDTYEQAKKSITAISQTPEAAEARMSESLGGLQLADPDMAFSTGVSGMRAMGVLAQALPNDERDFGKDVPPSPQEITSFLQVLSAIQNPVGLMHDINSGTLTQNTIDAVRQAYPSLYSRMQLDVIERLQEEKEAGNPIPYAQLVSADQFVGGGVSSLTDPMFYSRIADDSAQTQGQEQALRGSPLNVRRPQDQSPLERINNL